MLGLPKNPDVPVDNLANWEYLAVYYKSATTFCSFDYACERTRTALFQGKTIVPS